jgi:hypothetical protein
MKLIKINKSEISDAREVAGLLQAHIEYEVKSAQGRLEYVGPPFLPEMWHQVLSFFRWTHKETKSESQVRLYVNLVLGRWGAWAFPQAARTGLSARELPEPETPEKARHRFAFWESEPSDDWLYFGTVHHHCSASAFQSGTDEENERNQDGLHLTVGRMDEERHDLHARFYLGGNCYEPDLSRFWPIDPELAAQVPTGMHDALARFQMGRRVTLDFPDAWRANLVEVAVTKSVLVPSHDWGLGQEDLLFPGTYRLEEAIEEINRRCRAHAIRPDQWLAELDAIAASDASQFIIQACLRHGVSPEELRAAMTATEFESSLG